MLATWLVEIYLSKINQLEDIAAAERAADDVENFKAEQSMLEDDMRQFLSTYKVSLSLENIYLGLDAEAALASRIIWIKKLFLIFSPVMVETK